MKYTGLAIALTTSLIGCVNDPRMSNDTVYLGGRTVPGPSGGDRRMSFDNVSYWDGDHASGPARIRIRLGEQKAYFYRGDQLVGISILSTGREGYGTPSGTFKIQQKDRDHVSSVYGDYVDARTGDVIVKDIDRRKDRMPPGAKYDGAKMPFFMRVHGGVGMHEGFLPGYPASHGCIRMPGFMAEAFFRNVDVGTPVSIEP
ncbi:MAG: L,D-transpeptidase family protein [Chthoniobacteraceae bacterium]